MIRRGIILSSVAPITPYWTTIAERNPSGIAMSERTVTAIEAIHVIVLLAPKIPVILRTL